MCKKSHRHSGKRLTEAIYTEVSAKVEASKVTKELRKTGECISQRTVGKYMREMGIKAQWVKPWTTTTRDSDFSKELHNVLDEQFNPDRPNAVWCTDITYIWTTDGFVYLNCIMDLYSRKIIAWTLADSLEVSTVISTIEKAKASRDIDILIHWSLNISRPFIILSVYTVIVTTCHLMTMKNCI